MIARITPYRSPPGDLAPLIDEVVAIARVRSRWPVERPSRSAEFFFVNSSTGDALSLVIGDDRSVTPVVELAQPPSDDPEEFSVHLRQVGGPTGSGVVDTLLGRVVRCEPGTVADLTFDGDAVPLSTAVWARGILVAEDGGVLAFAVATDREALAQSLEKFDARCTRIDDYDDVAYHFFVDAPD
jgi:hypothetical protein